MTSALNDILFTGNSIRLFSFRCSKKRLFSFFSCGSIFLPLPILDLVVCGTTFLHDVHYLQVF